MDYCFPNQTDLIQQYDLSSVNKLPKLQDWMELREVMLDLHIEKLFYIILLPLFLYWTFDDNNKKIWSRAFPILGFFPGLSHILMSFYLDLSSASLIYVITSITII